MLGRRWSDWSYALKRSYLGGVEWLCLAKWTYVNAPGRNVGTVSGKGNSGDNFTRRQRPRQRQRLQPGQRLNQDPNHRGNRQSSESPSVLPPAPVVSGMPLTTLTLPLRQNWRSPACLSQPHLRSQGASLASKAASLVGNERLRLRESARP